MTKTYPTAAAIMACLRVVGLSPTYTPPTGGLDGEISVTDTITIQRCLYAGGYQVNRWIESEQAMQHYTIHADAAGILREVAAALADEA